MELRQAGQPSSEQNAIKFIVGDKVRGVFGFTWRLGSGHTSFYIRPSSRGVDVKLSLHGPDPRHPRPGFKLTDDAPPTAVRGRDYVMAASPGFLPCWFPGNEVADGVRHVFRLRSPWDLFVNGPGTAPGRLKGTDLGLVVEAPPVPLAADLDVYVSDGSAYWPHEAIGRRNNSLLGPLVNKAGQTLTAISWRRNMFQSPTPERAIGRTPANVSDRVRGIGATVDDSGFVWIVEQWMSESALAAGHHEPASHKASVSLLDSVAQDWVTRHLGRGRCAELSPGPTRAPQQGR